MKRSLLTLSFVAMSAVVITAQEGLDPAMLTTARTDAWPTFNGDYSGRRYSTLTDITTTNVKSLSLAWTSPVAAGGPVKATPLMVHGVVYVSTPDHAYAIDARTGRQRWHYTWPTKGGNHLANRGLGMLGDTLYMETPDCALVAINMRDGTKKWDVQICDQQKFYYASAAPVIIKNQVIVGVSGDDLDNPGYLSAHDPATGAMKWRWWAVPQKKGDPGSETWSDPEQMKNGGGMTWTPPTYDPELNLIFITTGNPQPVIAHKNRIGDNLYTGSIVALNADTGERVWHFQSSPHDTHDWDSTQTAVVFDGTVNGQPRKLIAQAARNGHFFLLDRTNGKALVSTEYVKTNWTLGYDAKGQPIPNPAKHPQIDGALVSPNQGGGTNWQSPTFSPRTGLFYVAASRGYSIYYIYDPSDNPAGWGGIDRGGYTRSMLQAIDYKTGKIRWTHNWHDNTRTGLLSTAGNVIFTGGSGGIQALDATNGDALWHSRIGTVTNAPITYSLDGQQYVVVATANTLFAFVLNR